MIIVDQQVNGVRLDGVIRWEMGQWVNGAMRDGTRHG